MSVLVERSDVIFARENTLEVPSAPLLRKKQNGGGGSLSLSPTSTPDETESAAVEIHQRPIGTIHQHQQHPVRHLRGFSSHSPYNMELDHPPPFTRNTFFTDE